jgi:hypothetical protein
MVEVGLLAYNMLSFLSDHNYVLNSALYLSGYFTLMLYGGISGGATDVYFSMTLNEITKAAYWCLCT